MRYIIFNIMLHYTDGSSAPITIAAYDKMKLEDIINKNKYWFEKNKKTLSGWKFMGEKLLFALPQEQYDEEVSFCDIVDEIE